jgi:hypothetical protein
MIEADPSLEPDWDEDNIAHVAKHGSDPNRLRKSIMPRDHIQPSLSKTKRRKAE